MSPHNIDRPRVLLVDDFPPMLDRAAEVLTPTCEIVGAVQNGLAALHAAANLQPDVIVLDIALPDIDGLQVAARLGLVGSTSAVVFLTLYDDDAMIEAAKNAGGLGYVVKRRLEADLVRAVLEARAGRPFTSKILTAQPKSKTTAAP